MVIDANLGRKQWFVSRHSAALKAAAREPMFRKGGGVSDVVTAGAQAPSSK